MDVGGLWAKELAGGYRRKADGAGAGKGSPASSAADDLCPACKRNGRVYCPHKPVLAIQAEMAQQMNKTDFFGPSPPNVFVGHYGYPTINWGPMVALQDGIPDNPRDWYGWGFDEIVRARSLQVRGKKEGGVRIAAVSPGMGREASVPQLLARAQEAALSSAPVDVEVHFSKAPAMRLEFGSVHQPMGASAPLEKLALADNPKVPKKVDEVIGEGLKAGEAMSELAHDGLDEHYLTRLLTAGLLGKPSSRKLVPTRWGITAVDDTLAKMHMQSIRDMAQGSDFLLYCNEYLANRFTILLLPGAWEYEGFEAWVGPSGKFAVSRESEPFDGRSDYAASQGGGYYAARLGVAEALAEKVKRQYRVVVIREILPEYDLPVGVWEIRENVRHAFMQKGETFATQEELLAAVRARLRLPLTTYSSRSGVLRQKRLMEF
ncbi:MAG: hypothetical protein KGH63_00020 [Candidatus Micrarchaeota archaeon]|nr:hypothetical protein [Candidatus Micrarchaeota archaeon]